ncbi:M24 family metallopeptidase [Clostridium sp. DL1XJH146]
MIEKRVKNVIRKMKDMGLCQLLISNSLAIYYLTGHLEHPGERFFALYLNTKGEHKLYANQLFLIKGDLGVDIKWYNDTDNIMEKVSEDIITDDILGIDKELPAKFLIPLIELNAATDYKLGSYSLDYVRGIKDLEEQEKMKTVSHINDLAMDKLKSLIKEGISEKEIEKQLLDIYINLGADGYSFEPLIAFGGNAAEPHHFPDESELKEGQCVLFDIGCKKDMYCADMTRTFFCKSVSENHRKIYNLVQEANEKAIESIKPGMKFKDIDKIARDIISEAGYGEYFTHRLGHFIGMDVHEYGDVSSTNENLIEEGMIFSIEPGIYIENDIGVRIEDLVLVKGNGCERLNKYSKVLQIIS